MEIEIKSNPDFPYKGQWEPGELFCPWCGKKPVWEEKTERFYDEVGPLRLCTSCGMEFTIDHSRKPDELNRAIINAMCEGPPR